MAASHPDSATLRMLAAQAARIGAGAALLATRGPIAVTLKADDSEVSQADLASQRAITDAIRSARPDDAIVGEESDSQPPATAGASPYAWIIDPIDGTRNFLRGVPLWAVSVGVLRNGRPIAGAIYHPAMDEMFDGSPEEGAFVNGRPVRRLDEPRATREFRSPKIVAAIPSTSEGTLCSHVDAWIERAVIRSLGSTALHLAYVAAGRFDAALISDSKLWDIAAGWALIIAAGGICESLDPRATFPVDVSTHPNTPFPCVAGRSPAILSRLAVSLRS